MEENLDFNTLIIKFLSQEISDEELEELMNWLEKDPANRRLFDKENELWHDSSIRTKYDYFKTDKAWADMSNVLGIAGKRHRNTKIFNRSHFKMILVAASFIFLLTAGASTFWFIKNKPSEMPVTITQIQTDAGEKARVFLSDSTLVTINSGSTLEYNSEYNIDDRVVRLKGEAYFDVRTNPEKPFIVDVGGMRIYAVGTKFNVFSYENEDRLETTLEEGKIHIYMNNEQQNIDIRAGQQMVYFPKTNKAVVRDVSTETYTSWKENKLRFIDVPFEEVLRQISRRYNVVFEVRGRDLLALRYTATFIDESINDVMEMLGEVSPIKYKIIKRTTADDKKYLKPKILVERSK